MPDVKPIPSFAFAVVPGYNVLLYRQPAFLPFATHASHSTHFTPHPHQVPELYKTTPLVLSFQVISEIMLGTSPATLSLQGLPAYFPFSCTPGNIVKWNDSQIAALNPNISNLLPNANIVVVYNTPTDPITLMWTSALSRAVPGFNSAVGPLSQFTPLVPTASLVGVNATVSPMQPMSTTTYTFTMWSSNELQALRNVKVASLENWAGNTVDFSLGTIQATLDDWTGDTDSTTAVPFPSLAKRDSTCTSSVSGQRRLELTFLPHTTHTAVSSNSWPMVMYNQMWVYQSTMTNCNKAKSLADWLYWTQTDSEALTSATRNYVLPLSSVDRFNKTILTRIASMTCNGVAVSSVAGCVYQGMVCADAGACVNSKCVCHSDRQGEYCQTAVRLRTPRPLLRGKL